jgi:hexosaminidase
MKQSLAFLLILALFGCSQDNPEITNNNKQIPDISQSQLDDLAKKLEIKYQFISNIETDCPDKEDEKVDHCYGAIIHIVNKESLLAKNWQLNYSQVYPMYAFESEQFNVEHLNGDIHRISPKDEFKGLVANENYQIKLWMKATLITESAVLPNYWLSSDKLEAKVVSSTRTGIDPETLLEIQPYVVPFSDLPTQVKSAPNDINEYASAAWLFDHNKDTAVDLTSLDIGIIPTPALINLTSTNSALDISNGFTYQFVGVDPNDLGGAIKRLADLGINQTENGAPVTITVNSQNKIHREGYQLTISASGINILANSSKGAFYALQSIASLYKLNQTKLPLVNIQDAPHYDYRGQHLDVARNFVSKDFIINLIKQMSAIKLNTLHLHLAEDEAWRLELPSFPELTEIGGKRCMDLSDKHCLQPQLGSAGDSSRDGYLSMTDYHEILSVANQHFVTVVPSLDMPGHSRAAIKAMEARYYHFMKQEDEAAATEYLLSDLNDKTEYRSIQNYTDNTINVCKESSYRFVERVLDDLISMHKSANHPLTTYHIGADETAGAWIDSPECQALAANPNNDVHELEHLGAHFIERVAHIVANRGILPAGWNDGMSETRIKNMPQNAVSYIWGALPWGAHQQLSEQAHRGWDVILSVPDVFYFDFPYEVDPKERGYHWASRRIDSRNIFNFMPDNLPVHAEFRVDTLGQPFEIDDRPQKDKQGKVTHQPLPKKFKIKGIQGQLWTETVRSNRQASYMIFPRIYSLAERAWHKPDWAVPYDYKGDVYNKESNKFSEDKRQQQQKDWQSFSNNLSIKQLPKLEKEGIFYRLPTVGAVVKEGTLYANVSLPGLPIEYKLQSTDLWMPYKGPVPVSGTITIRTRSYDGKRAGRSLTVIK